MYVCSVLLDAISTIGNLNKTSSKFKIFFVLNTNTYHFIHSIWKILAYILTAHFMDQHVSVMQTLQTHNLWKIKTSSKS